MAKQLEGRAREIVEQGKNYAHVAVPRMDGTVETVIVWVDTDDDGNITLNSAEGRVWPENLRRAGTATVDADGRQQPVRVRLGHRHLEDDTHEGAEEHIDSTRKSTSTRTPYPSARTASSGSSSHCAPSGSTTSTRVAGTGRDVDERQQLVDDRRRRGEQARGQQSARRSRAARARRARTEHDAGGDVPALDAALVVGVDSARARSRRGRARRCRRGACRARAGSTAAAPRPARRARAAS